MAQLLVAAPEDPRGQQRAVTAASEAASASAGGVEASGLEASVLEASRAPVPASKPASARIAEASEPEMAVASETPPASGVASDPPAEEEWAQAAAQAASARVAPNRNCRRGRRAAPRAP